VTVETAALKTAIGISCIAALAATLAGCGSGGGFAAICKSPGEGVTASKATPQHIFGLSVTTGVEVEHTRSQIESRHIEHGGDTLLAGRLRTIVLDRAGKPRHFELHICDARSGRTLTGLRPEMAVRDVSTGTRPVAIPLATLIGTGEPADDLHYGNHVVMRSGHAYEVSVRLGRDHVSLPIGL
jgi:hypothetical protein